jgi:hypothetical protein
MGSERVNLLGVAREMVVVEKQPGLWLSEEIHRGDPLEIESKSNRIG